MSVNYYKNKTGLEVTKATVVFKLNSDLNMLNICLVNYKFVQVKRSLYCFETQIAFIALALYFCRKIRYLRQIQEHVKKALIPFGGVTINI